MTAGEIHTLENAFDVCVCVSREQRLGVIKRVWLCVHIHMISAGIYRIQHIRYSISTTYIELGSSFSYVYVRILDNFKNIYASSEGQLKKPFACFRKHCTVLQYLMFGMCNFIFFSCWLYSVINQCIKDNYERLNVHLNCAIKTVGKRYKITIMNLKTQSSTLQIKRSNPQSRIGQLISESGLKWQWRQSQNRNCKCGHCLWYDFF